MKRLFNLFSPDASGNYRDTNRRKKVHRVVLIYRLISRQPPFCVFADAFNLFFFIIRTLLSDLRFLTLLWIDGKLGSSTGFTLSCHKLENGQEKKVLRGQGKVKEINRSQRKFVFFRDVRENIFFLPIQVLE